MSSTNIASRLAFLIALTLQTGTPAAEQQSTSQRGQYIVPVTINHLPMNYAECVRSCGRYSPGSVEVWFPPLPTNPAEFKALQEECRRLEFPSFWLRLQYNSSLLSWTDSSSGVPVSLMAESSSVSERDQFHGAVRFETWQFADASKEPSRSLLKKTSPSDDNAAVFLHNCTTFYAVAADIISPTLWGVDGDNESVQCFCQTPSNDKCKVVGRYVCHDNASCVNRSGMSNCECNTGYTGDGYSQCNDVDECQVGGHSCKPNSHCQNTWGSYLCACLAGYTQGVDKQCTDIDECNRTGSTAVCHGSATCHNSPGSYKCSCTSGYSLDHTGRKCHDIDECNATGTAAVCSRNATCHNTLGSYKCMCQSGYSLDETGRDCKDIDECNATGTAAVCSGNATCHNTLGSYKCQCLSGYSLDETGRVCKDIDECNATGTAAACSRKATCHNTLGSYKCMCQSGYSLDQTGRDCKDIDECNATGTAAACSGNATCHNTPGSYKCQCLSGYSLNETGRDCKDVDECNVNGSAAACPTSSTCENTLGSFRCLCSLGYSLDKKDNTCKDIDECSIKRLSSCPYNTTTCVNTEGSFNCRCKTGFSRHKNGQCVVDVTEENSPSSSVAHSATIASGAFGGFLLIVAVLATLRRKQQRNRKISAQSDSSQPSYGLSPGCDMMTDIENKRYIPSPMLRGKFAKSPSVDEEDAVDYAGYHSVMSPKGKKKKQLSRQLTCTSMYSTTFSDRRDLDDENNEYSDPSLDYDYAQHISQLKEENNNTEGDMSMMYTSVINSVNEQESGSDAECEGSPMYTRPAKFSQDQNVSGFDAECDGSPMYTRARTFPKDPNDDSSNYCLYGRRQSSTESTASAEYSYRVFGMPQLHQPDAETHTANAMQTVPLDVVSQVSYAPRRSVINHARKRSDALTQSFPGEHHRYLQEDQAKEEEAGEGDCYDHLSSLRSSNTMLY